MDSSSSCLHDALLPPRPASSLPRMAEVLLTFEDAQVYRSDLALLRNNDWLNDQ